jgi:hypothetical protein
MRDYATGRVAGKITDQLPIAYRLLLIARRLSPIAYCRPANSQLLIALPPIAYCLLPC